MNEWKILGHLTDPTKFKKQETKQGEKLIFATVAINRFKGTDTNGESITEPVFIKFAAYRKQAETLASLNKGARVHVELNPYNKINTIEGKNYTSIEFTLKHLHVLDWPNKEFKLKEKPEMLDQPDENNNVSEYSDITEKKGWS